MTTLTEWTRANVLQPGWTRMADLPGNPWIRLSAPGPEHPVLCAAWADEANEQVVFHSAGPGWVPPGARREFLRALFVANRQLRVGHLQLDPADGEVVLRTDHDFEGAPRDVAILRAIAAANVGSWLRLHDALKVASCGASMGPEDFPEAWPEPEADPVADEGVAATCAWLHGQLAGAFESLTLDADAGALRGETVHGRYDGDHLRLPWVLEAHRDGWIVARATLPYRPTAETEWQVLHLANRINRASLIGGFDVDLERGEIRHRTALFATAATLCPGMMTGLVWLGNARLRAHAYHFRDVASGAKLARQIEL